MSWIHNFLYLNWLIILNKFIWGNKRNIFEALTILWTIFVGIKCTTIVITIKHKFFYILSISGLLIFIFFIIKLRLLCFSEIFCNRSDCTHLLWSMYLQITYIFSRIHLRASGGDRVVIIWISCQCNLKSLFSFGENYGTITAIWFLFAEVFTDPCRVNFLYLSLTIYWLINVFYFSIFFI